MWTDATETGPGAVLISHSLWHRQYGNQTAALGRTVTFDDRAWTVVGVIPPEFELPNIAADTIAASYMPARRAFRISPVEALRLD